MNRNNRLYTVDADGEKQFTPAGLVFQIWALSEGAGELLTNEGRRIARHTVDNVIGLWRSKVTEMAGRTIPNDKPASEMSDAQIYGVIDLIEEACKSIGAARVLEIITYSTSEATELTVH